MDSARKSLFYYQPEDSWATFYDPYFHPFYQPTFNNPELETQAKDICGDDKFCLFDIATTGITEIGVATRESSKFLEQINSFLIPGNCFCIHLFLYQCEYLSLSLWPSKQCLSNHNYMALFCHSKSAS